MTVYKSRVKKPRVRRVAFGIWVAERPGGAYLLYGGMHFNSWSAAIEYALGHWGEVSS